MLPGKRDEIAVGDLICADHQFRPHHAVGATQVVGNKFMARVGDELSEDAKRQFGRQAVTKQRMRGDARKTKLDNRAGRKRGNALEPRTGFCVMLVIFPEQRDEQVDVEQSGSRRPAFNLVNELRSDASAIGMNDRQAVAFCADGKFAARYRTAIFCDELCDSHLFIRGQFFDLLNDFKCTHGLIIRQK